MRMAVVGARVLNEFGLPRHQYLPASEIYLLLKRRSESMQPSSPLPIHRQRLLL